VGGVGDLDAAGRVGFEFGEGFVDNDRHITSISQDEVVGKWGSEVNLVVLTADFTAENSAATLILP
jgi:hypothetical protein